MLNKLNNYLHDYKHVKFIHVEASRKVCSIVKNDNIDSIMTKSIFAVTKVNKSYRVSYKMNIEYLTDLI